MEPFRFKQFAVMQDNSAMRVNTDGVLLGAWMEILPADAKLLDIGTGTGVIALMAAQRIKAFGSGISCGRVTITAIDIDGASLEDAAVNFRESGFEDETLLLEPRLIPFQELAMETDGTSLKYDLIFSNPPYFINSLKAADQPRSNARHTDTLGQGEILYGVQRTLAEGGRLALVLPAVEGEQLLDKVNYLGDHAKDGPALHLKRLCRVHTTIKKPAKRWLMEFVFSREKPSVQESSLIMMADGDYTEQYRQLTGEFYLNF